MVVETMPFLSGDGPEQVELWSLLHEVKDPELPVISIVELGIVRRVAWEGGRVEVDITPTYSGCPAMQLIEEEIAAVLAQHGFGEVHIRTVFQPAWTTDWISAEAKHKMREYGIAPPDKAAPQGLIPLASVVRRVCCPLCNSRDVVLQSEFGSTACKSLYNCKSCHQPFEYFKSI